MFHSLLGYIYSHIQYALSLKVLTQIMCLQYAYEIKMVLTVGFDL